MHTDEDLRQRIMVERRAAGLYIRLRTPEGETTLYPKDHQTKARWITQAQRKGYVILEGGPCV